MNFAYFIQVIKNIGSSIRNKEPITTFAVHHGWSTIKFE